MHSKQRKTILTLHDVFWKLWGCTLVVGNRLELAQNIFVTNVAILLPCDHDWSHVHRKADPASKGCSISSVVFD